MTGMTSALLVRPLLRRLPEPIPGGGTPSYRELGSTRFLFACGALAAIAAAVSWHSLPRYAQPMWCVLAILGVLLAAIDARTSWLPLQLTRFAWLAMAGAALLAAPLGGGFWVPVRAAAAAADSWALLSWTLLLGTVVGGLAGVLRLARGRREAFPYAPSMLLGAYAAC